MNMEDIRRYFKDPPASHRTAPLWVWNDLMNKEQIAFQLKELKNHGFGGAFVHPRPGLITEYLSDEWFDMWGFALKTASKTAGANTVAPARFLLLWREGGAA